MSYLDRFREHRRSREEPEVPMQTRRPLDIHYGLPLPPAPAKLSLIDKLRLMAAFAALYKKRHLFTMKNWKTTFFGTGGLLVIWTPVIAAALDADPATIPNFAAALGATLPAIGLLFAKDYNVSGQAK